MLTLSAPEFVHALDTEALRHPDLTVWSARLNIDNKLDLQSEGKVVACIALKILPESTASGEVKSMKVAAGFLRQGLGNALLNHVIDHAQVNKLTSLKLETGSHAFFDPARRLYEARGFQKTEAFGAYSKNPHSVFYTLEL